MSNAPYRDAAKRDAKRINSRSEMPAKRKMCRYCWQTSEGQRCIKVKNTERQILEQLRRTPIYAASVMQLSAYVSRLRGLGAPIETHNFKNADTGGLYGIYALNRGIHEHPDACS